MKHLLKLLILTPAIFFAQIPAVQEFNPGNGWTFILGSGIETIGGDSYLSTNPGGAFYPNSSALTITSPLMTLNTGCASGLTNIWVYFPISGIIDPGDNLKFQYRISPGVWVTLGSAITGAQNTTISMTNVPNSAVQFRFLLTTNATVNSYLVGGVTTPYGYDISKLSINCLAALPVELVSFTGKQASHDENILEWDVEAEVGSDYYLIEKRTDSGEWEEFSTIDCKGSNSYHMIDERPENVINYYRLTQVDTDGLRHVYDEGIVSIDNRFKEKQISQIINLLGQSCSIDEPGVVILQYTDGSIEKKFNQ